MYNYIEFYKGISSIYLSTDMTLFMAVPDEIWVIDLYTNSFVSSELIFDLKDMAVYEMLDYQFSGIY